MTSMIINPKGLSETEVAALLTRNGLGNHEVTRPERGLSGRIFRLLRKDEVAYLKLNSPAGISQQIALSRLLLEADIPGPRVLESGEDRETGLGFIVMSAVRGSPIGRRPQEKETRNDVLRQAGITMARLHQVGVPGFGNFSLRNGKLEGKLDSWNGYLAAKAPEVSNLVDQQILPPTFVDFFAMVLERLEETAPSEGVLLHNDLHGGNIFAENNQMTALIDWDRAVSGDPMFDLAKSSHGLEDDFAELRKGYTGPVDEERLMLCQTFVFTTKIARVSQHRPKRLPYNIRRLDALMEETGLRP